MSKLKVGDKDRIREGAHTIGLDEIGDILTVTHEELERWKTAHAECLKLYEDHLVSSNKMIEDLRFDLSLVKFSNKEHRQEVEHLRSKLDAAEQQVKVLQSAQFLPPLAPKRVPPKAFVLKDSQGETIAQGVEFDRGAYSVSLNYIKSGHTVSCSVAYFTEECLAKRYTVHYAD